MKLFDVYPLFDIEPVKAEGSFIWDKKGTKYLDLYGGHAVISIGHSHQYYVQKLLPFSFHYEKMPASLHFRLLPLRYYTRTIDNLNTLKVSLIFPLALPAI